jgi:hypothetical protein
MLVVTHICTMYTYFQVAAPTIWNILPFNVRSAGNITQLNCHIKHTFKTLSRMVTTLPRQFHFHQTATILQRHMWP